MDTGIENTEEKQANGVMDATETKSEAKSEKKEKPWIAAGFSSRSAWRASKSGAKKVEVETKTETASKPATKKKGKTKTTMKTETETKTKAPSKKKAPAKKTKVKAVSTDKPKVKTKTTYIKKHNYPTTAAERRKSQERTAHFMKVAAKREEPNMDEARILKSVRVGSTTTIDKMSELFAGTLAKRKSKVRNALRWCVASKHFKRLDRGEYKRLK